MTAQDMVLGASREMPSGIERARVEDYAELMRLLDICFGKEHQHWFARNIAARYHPTPESMGNNLIARREGRIVSCVGVFPIRMRFGGRPLRVAGVGGVCTHPAHRGTGLMRELMLEACRSIDREGYELSFLTGQRQRYAFFGWEKAGFSLRAEVTRDNVRHQGTESIADALNVAPLVLPSREELASMHAWHEAREIHTERGEDSFAAYLTHWGGTVYGARDARGRLRGFAVLASDGKEISELAKVDQAAALALVRALAAERGAVVVDLGPVLDETGRAIAAMSEMVRIHDVYNWKVFDWRAVLEVLLACRAAAGALEGGVTLAIEGEVQALRVEVRDGLARVTRTDEPPALRLSAALATRALLGPVKPGQLVMLEGDARILDAWCPLPLWLGRQDHV